MSKKLMISILILLSVLLSTVSFAAIMQQQGKDVAEFAKTFIDHGNNRRDVKGYPLITYALTGSWNKNVEIRNRGYNEQLFYIKRNGYHIKNGRYVELGNKWCMDCGTYLTYMLKKTLGLELYNGREPWHVQDIYNDARKGANSKYFEFVYSAVAVGRIDYSKLQPGDVIARITSNGNHGMLYVGDGLICHANRDMITYRNPAVFGFQVSKLNKYYLPSTVVRVMRIKDGIIPTDLEVDPIIVWPDNNEEEYLIEHAKIAKIEADKRMKREEELRRIAEIENEKHRLTLKSAKGINKLQIASSNDEQKQKYIQNQMAGWILIDEIKRMLLILKEI